MLVFYILFAIIALAGMSLFGAGRIFCILLLISAAAGGIMCVLSDEKLRGLSAVWFPVCLAMCLFAGQGFPAGETGDYGDRIHRAAVQIDRGNADRGVEMLDELDEEFGVTDLSLYARAEIYITLGEYGTALSCMDQVYDKTDEYWYAHMERIYGCQGTQESLESLEELYLAAARDLPENAHMQYMAGMVKMGEDSYQSAVYYLQRADVLDETDPLPSYYLGVIHQQQGRQADADRCFEEALDRGLDQEREENIQYYRNRSANPASGLAEGDTDLDSTDERGREE